MAVHDIDTDLQFDGKKSQDRDQFVKWVC
jgi:hypothetical protein